MLRNIYHIDDEDASWRQVLEQFPNNVPRFQSKSEAEEFVKKHCVVGSNPIDSNLQHSVSTLINWNQIESFLLPKLHEYYYKWQPLHIDKEEIRAKNLFMNSKQINSSPLNIEIEEECSKESKIYDYLVSRLNLSIHDSMCYESTMNTLRYMFFHMRCGILVMIRNNQIVLFCPFVNTQYKNTWANALQLKCVDGKVETYYNEKSAHYRQEEYLPDKIDWWANGNIICNEYTSDTRNGKANQWWGDHFLLQVKDMFAEACRHRVIPDCEFFINKRDYPHLKFNPYVDGGIAVEPYGFLFDKDDRDPTQDLPLARHFYKSYAPIFSFYVSERFADIPVPCTEDWEAATGAVFPASFVHTTGDDGEPVILPSRDLFTQTNLKKFERPWNEKVPTAFFRGTATGGGVTIETNQRLRVAQISFHWSNQSQLNGTSADKNHGYPYLDAKITGWNKRDKKIASEKMTYLHEKDFPFDGYRKKNFVEIYKQSTYKYVLYIEGHCAACRYGFMMQLGSVILKVDSLCVADQMWYFPMLKPYEDHVPVKADLSNLQEILDWCHNNDEKCEQIALQAKATYDKFISRDGILDYIQSITVGIYERWKHVPTFARNPPESKPKIQVAGNRVQECVTIEGKGYLCSYCEDVKSEDQKKISETETLLGKRKNNVLRDRMKTHAINNN